jgi:hypothetical protein
LAVVVGGRWRFSGCGDGGITPTPRAGSTRPHKLLDEVANLLTEMRRAVLGSTRAAYVSRQDRSVH